MAIVTSVSLDKDVGIYFKYKVKRWNIRYDHKADSIVLRMRFTDKSDRDVYIKTVCRIAEELGLTVSNVIDIPSWFGPEVCITYDSYLKFKTYLKLQNLL